VEVAVVPDQAEALGHVLSSGGGFGHIGGEM